MNSHKNAPLTPKGREAMVRSVVEGGLSQADAANTTPAKPRRMGPCVRPYALKYACEPELGVILKRVMRHKSLVNEDWANIVARLGGAEELKVTARETKAFLRPREITSAVDLLRLILAYCLGERGLRSTAAWAASVGLVDISNVALLYRLRQCGDWLAMLVGRRLLARLRKRAVAG